MMDLLPLLNWLSQTAVAFLATIAFAVIFHTPRRELLFTGFTGGAGWLVYLIAGSLGCGVASATIFAARAQTRLYRMFSV